MKGIYIKQPQSIEIEDLPLPQAEPGQAVVQIKAAGICGSDVTAYKGSNPTMTYPRVMGHEVAGVITEIAPNKYGLQKGDRVVVEPYFYCGKCYPCRKGIFNNCEEMNVLGVRMDGGMAEYIAHPIAYLHKLPEDLPWEKAAMVEPLSISLHAFHRAKVLGGEHVAIFGAGTIGLLAALICKAYGAKPILLDVLESRLFFAKNMGITHTILSNKENAEQEIDRITNGERCPVVLECSGAPSAINTALELASYSGRICLVGWAPGAIEFNQPRVLRKELTLFGSRNSYNEFPECIDLIHSGKVNVEPLIHLRYSMEETMQGFLDVAKEPEKYLKIVGLL